MLLVCLVLFVEVGRVCNRAVHELGHAGAVKALGGEIQEMRLWKRSGQPARVVFRGLDKAETAVVGCSGSLVASLCGVLMTAALPWRRVQPMLGAAAAGFIFPFLFTTLLLALPRTADAQQIAAVVPQWLVSVGAVLWGGTCVAWWGWKMGGVLAQRAAQPAQASKAA